MFHFEFRQNPPRPCRIPGPRATFKIKISKPRATFLSWSQEGCTQVELTETFVCHLKHSWRWRWRRPIMRIHLSFMISVWYTFQFGKTQRLSCWKSDSNYISTTFGGSKVHYQSGLAIQTIASTDSWQSLVGFPRLSTVFLSWKPGCFKDLN